MAYDTKLDDLTTREKDTVLTELKERFDYGVRMWSDVREDYSENMKVAGGDPWAADDRRAARSLGVRLSHWGRVRPWARA